MTIIGESGDIGQLQWYGILFYTDYPLCPIPACLHFHCIAVLPAIRFEDMAPLSCFTLPVIELPPEVANGMTVLPEKSYFSKNALTGRGHKSHHIG